MSLLGGGTHTGSNNSLLGGGIGNTNPGNIVISNPGGGGDFDFGRLPGNERGELIEFIDDFGRAPEIKMCAICKTIMGMGSCVQCTAISNPGSGSGGCSHCNIIGGGHHNTCPNAPVGFFPQCMACGVINGNPACQFCKNSGGGSLQDPCPVCAQQRTNGMCTTSNCSANPMSSCPQCDGPNKDANGNNLSSRFPFCSASCFAVFNLGGGSGGTNTGIKCLQCGATIPNGSTQCTSIACIFANQQRCDECNAILPLHKVACSQATGGSTNNCLPCNGQKGVHTCGQPPAIQCGVCLHTFGTNPNCTACWTGTTGDTPCADCGIIADLTASGICFACAWIKFGGGGGHPRQPGDHAILSVHCAQTDKEYANANVHATNEVDIDGKRIYKGRWQFENYIISDDTDFWNVSVEKGRIHIIKSVTATVTLPMENPPRSYILPIYEGVTDANVYPIRELQLMTRFAPASSDVAFELCYRSHAQTFYVLDIIMEFTVND